MVHSSLFLDECACACACPIAEKRISRFIKVIVVVHTGTYWCTWNRRHLHQRICWANEKLCRPIEFAYLQLFISQSKDSNCWYKNTPFIVDHSKKRSWKNNPKRNVNRPYLHSSICQKWRSVLAYNKQYPETLKKTFVTCKFGVRTET